MRTNSLVRSAWGTVSSTATIVNYGSADWSVTKLATGQYQLHFAQPFRNLPVLAVSSAGSTTVGTSAINDRTRNVYVYSTAGAALDGSFSFQATERERV